MSVNAIPSVNISKPIVEAGAPQNPVEKPLVAPEQKAPADLVDFSEPKQKKSFSTRFVEGIGKIAKFFVGLNEMTKATFKGIGGAFAAGGATLATFWAFGTLPRAFKAGKESMKEVVKHPLKNISKAGKVTAGVLAAGALTYHIIKGVLTMNKRTANVDHSLKIGHRDV